MVCGGCEWCRPPDKNLKKFLGYTKRLKNRKETTNEQEEV